MYDFVLFRTWFKKKSAVVSSCVALIIFTLLTLSFQAQAAQVSLAWDAPDASIPSGYKVYYGTSSAAYTRNIDAGNLTSCTITGLDEDQTYYFAATAYYPDGAESGYSNEASKYITKSDGDGDGLFDADEVNIYGTDPVKMDTDDDGLGDGDEVKLHDTNPTNGDTDGDGLKDGDEVTLHGTSPTNGDTDGDGLKDGDEVTLHGTSPTNGDTDGDGLSDGDEVNIHATSPTNGDTDGDGIPDAEEINAANPPDGTDTAKVKLMWDVPDASVPTGYKVYYGTSSSLYTQHVDAGMNTYCTITGFEEEGQTYYFAVTAYYADGTESGYSNEVSKFIPKTDTDGDGISDVDEINIYGSDPRKLDTDGDDLSDGEEVSFYATNPTLGDTDGDGIGDGLEIISYGTDPKNPDTDGDGIPDGQETLTEIVQAEAGSLVLPMQIASETGTGSRTYIETTEPETGTSVYSVNVDVAGVYKIVALVYGPSGESDAFYVEVDDLGAFVWDINVQDNPGEFEVWKKDEMTDQETVSAEAPKGIPYTVALSPGLHTIVISGWEASARLDAFYLEKVAEIPDDPVDIEAPVVSIGAPAYGDQVKGTVTVDVQASDNIGVVRSELYVDSVLHMTSEIAPFEFSLDTTALPDGTYELFVKAYDAAGNVTQSETVLVYVQNVSTIPQVSIISPKSDSVVSTKKYTLIKVEATDDVGVTAIKLYINGSLIKTVYGSTLSYSWLPNRKDRVSQYTITAHAYDGYGNIGKDQIVVYK